MREKKAVLTESSSVFQPGFSLGWYALFRMSAALGRRSKGGYGMIEVRDLVKRYGRHTAVDHLSFTVERGQVYGFLGPNGAGKSTTMNIMTGYLGPTEGEVLVDGHSMTDEPEKARRHIGYLPEQPPLYVDMTVKEYLGFAAQLKKVPARARNGEIKRVMEHTMITDVSGRLIRNLSKGYKQRVGIAQALLGNPEIVVLDEPTVGLDPKQIIEIRTLIRELAKEHTVILSSHILAEVQAVCDRILIIHHGKMVASGTPEELERQLAGTTALEVTLKADEPTGRNLLRRVSGAGAVSYRPGAAEGESTFRVESRQGDLREKIFQACAAENVALLGLRSAGMTLEDVFLKLTADDSVREELAVSRARKKARADKAASGGEEEDKAE